MRSETEVSQTGATGLKCGTGACIQTERCAKVKSLLALYLIASRAETQKRASKG